MAIRSTCCLLIELIDLPVLVNRTNNSLKICILSPVIPQLVQRRFSAAKCLILNEMRTANTGSREDSQMRAYGENSTTTIWS
jgi:hypothetical protein